MAYQQWDDIAEWSREEPFRRRRSIHQALLFRGHRTGRGHGSSKAGT
jgi:hypothetical protein